MSKKNKRGFNPFAKKPAEGGGQDGTAASTREVSVMGRGKKEHVLRETAFSAAADLFRKNKPFCVKRDGETVWVGAKLELAKIGGLGPKDKGDESKGQIISLINNGDMSTLFTEALEAEDAIVFIPNEATVASMADFSLLGDTADYELVLVEPDNDGGYEPTGVRVKLANLQMLHRTGRSVDTLDGMDDVLADASLPEEAEDLGTVQEDERQEATFYDQTDAQDEPEPEPVGAMSAEQAAGVVDTYEDYGDDDGDVGFDEDIESEGLPDGAGGEGLDGQAYQEAVQPADQTVYVPEEVTARILARRFFNDSLDRMLTSESLDQAIEPSVAPQLEVKPDSWLNGQYNELVRIANTELRQMHDLHIMTLRQAYLDTMAAAYQKEMSAIADVESDPRYEAIAAKRQRMREDLPGDVDRIRKELNDAWDQKIQEVGEAARQQAVTSYRERYMPMHEERLRNAAMNEEARLNTAFETVLGQLKDARRVEAQNRLDELDTETIEELKAKYREMAQEEIDLFDQHRKKLLAFLEEYRTDELARIRTLDEELRQSDRFEKLEREHQARVQSLQEEFELRVMAMQDDMAKMRERHEVDLQAKDNEAQYAKTLHEQETAQQNVRIDQLLEDVGRLGDVARSEVAAEMARIQSERDETERKYDILVDGQKKHNRLMLSVGILAVIAALCAGLFFGGYFMQRRDLADRQNEVLQSVLAGMQDGEGEGQNQPGDEPVIPDGGPGGQN